MNKKSNIEKQTISKIVHSTRKKVTDIAIRSWIATILLFLSHTCL